MKHLSIRISDVAWARLEDLAWKQHRRPPEQAAVLIEQMLMAEGQITIEHTPRLTELGNGTALAVPEGEGAEA